MANSTKIAGMTFERLHVIERVPCPKRHASDTYIKQPWFRCKCACGAEVIRCGVHLTHGYTKSCGCLRRERGTAAAAAAHAKVALSPETIAAMRSMLLDGASNYAIAKKLGITCPPAATMRRKMGLPMYSKTRQPPMRLAA